MFLEFSIFFVHSTARGWSGKQRPDTSLGSCYARPQTIVILSSSSLDAFSFFPSHRITVDELVHTT